MYVEDVKDMIEKCVDILSKRYGFNKREGMGYLEEEKERKEKKKSKIPLPFCGKKEKGCIGLRVNHGLYTQCCKMNEGEICKTCIRQNIGTIDDRIEKGRDFKDKKGRSVVKYGNVMKKLNISRSEAEEEARLQGLIIPESEFEIKESKRGRPKKDTTVSDTASETSETPTEKRGRGRPKKEKKVITSDDSEVCLIKQLVEQSKKQQKEAETTMQPPKEIPKETTMQPPKETPKQPQPPKEIPKEIPKEPPKVPVEEPVEEPVEDESDDESDEESDEEETPVIMFEIEGKKYLKSGDNTLYDVKTHEPIGMWNTSTKMIEELDED